MGKKTPPKRSALSFFVDREVSTLQKKSPMSKEEKRRLEAVQKERAAAIGKLAVAIVGAVALTGWALVLMR